MYAYLNNEMIKREEYFRFYGWRGYVMEIYS